MSAYTVSKDEGKTLVTTIINANDAAEVGGNPVSLKMPKGISVAKASQVYGPSNETKGATQVISTNPLPDKIPYSGPKKTGGTDAESDENVLNIDLAASSATVFVMRKK